MNGDIHVRICEGLGGKFPGATRPAEAPEVRISRMLPGPAGTTVNPPDR